MVRYSHLRHLGSILMLKSWLLKTRRLPLGGWSYRKSITLSRASGAVTNYQMKLLVGESSGATGEDVDCGGKCASDFDDIRFTTSDGTTLLDYWIESVTGTTPNQLATIWIEFNSIGTSATTFYMYYGNASATAVSNGANTFSIFEDFEWGNDEDDITTSGGSLTWTSVQGSAKIDTAIKYGGTRSARFTESATSPIYTTPCPSSSNVGIRYRFYIDSGIVTNRANVSQGNGTERWAVLSHNGNLTYHGESATDTATAISTDTWHLMEICNFNFTPEGSYSIWLDGVNVANPTGMIDSATYSEVLRLLSDNYVGGGNWWIDNIMVRNWRSTEPAWGSWGTEETG